MSSQVSETSGPVRLHQAQPYFSIWRLLPWRTKVGSGPPYPLGQNGGVAQAIESLEKIQAIEVRFDKPSVRASSFVLLHDTPQSADLPQVADISQDAGYKRVQTPQIADIPSHTCGGHPAGKDHPSWRMVCAREWVEAKAEINELVREAREIERMF